MTADVTSMCPMAHWLAVGGFSSVVAPYGNAQGQARPFFVPTIFPVSSESPGESLNHEGDAGLGERSVNNQFILSNKSVPWADQITSSTRGGTSLDGFADHLAINNYATVSSDSHAIHAQQDSWLGAGECSIIVRATSGHGAESCQSESGAFIDGCTIFVLGDQTAECDDSKSRLVGCR